MLEAEVRYYTRFDVRDVSPSRSCCDALCGWEIIDVGSDVDNTS